MKRIKFVALLTTLCLAMPTANAADITVEVVKCSLYGNFTIINHIVSFQSNCAGLAVIPNSVTSIDDFAFSLATALTDVIILKSVTSIGTYPFSFATSLTGFTVDPANPNLSSDTQGVLYNKEKTILIQAPLAKSTIIIPDTVVLIEDDAFFNAKSLSTLIIPNTVKFPGLSLRAVVAAADKAAADKAAADKAAADKAAADKAVADANAAAEAAADKAAADKAVADAKAAADKAAAAAKKKTTITCIKGKLTKKVTAIKPKCPAGYKKK